MPFVVHPPTASMMSDGHSTALNLSLRLCRNPCTIKSSPITFFIHLFKAALAELALHILPSSFDGKDSDDLTMEEQIHGPPEYSQWEDRNS